MLQFKLKNTIYFFIPVLLFSFTSCDKKTDNFKDLTVGATYKINSKDDANNLVKKVLNSINFTIEYKKNTDIFSNKNNAYVSTCIYWDLAYLLSTNYLEGNKTQNGFYVNFDSIEKFYDEFFIKTAELNSFTLNAKKFADSDYASTTFSYYLNDKNIIEISFAGLTGNSRLFYTTNII